MNCQQLNGDFDAKERGTRDRARRDLTKQLHESSSDSDFYDLDGNFGPTTRKAWSDWCSNKGKSSQSEEEGATKVILVPVSRPVAY